MTNETETGASRIFVPAVLPWLLGGGMFMVYFLTLFHEPTAASITRLADVSGWSWRPQILGPVTYLATFPVRWLPAHLQLVALNLLAAGCAAIVLALLARSVSLLPHDRTNEQRQRAQGEFSLLTTPLAWLPPLFAVLVCGLQISFWERSVQFVDSSPYDSAEMINLVLFTYVVRCLLEFRIGERQSWLSRSALAFGLAITNNWGMIAFFPLYVIALVWIKGFDFFAWRFVVRMLVFGLAGLCLLLLLPLMVAHQHIKDFGIWQALRFVLGSDKACLMAIASYRRWFPVLAVTSILPVTLMGIRWASSFGDNSPLGIILANAAMGVAHGFFLVCCLWITMDPTFGPRQVVPAIPALPLFYLGALSIGYFSGYFLLVFGSRPAKQRQRTPSLQKWLNRGVLALVLFVAVVAPAMLVVHNLPRIQSARNIAAATEKYYAKVQQALPQRPAVILSDSPEMLFNLESLQARQEAGRADIFIDTSAVAQYWSYISFLESKHPQDNIGGIYGDRKGPGPTEPDAIHLLESLSGQHDIFYLQPSFGYYFERFYIQPHGLVYSMAEYPTNVWSPPPLDPALLSANRVFWKDSSNDVASLLHVLDEQPALATNSWQRFEQSALFASESNRAAGDLAKLYSRALTYWGVQLQRTVPIEETAAFLEPAESFETAWQLSQENGPALVNRNFNRELRQHKRLDIKSYSLDSKLPGTYRYWWDEIVTGGPFDHPAFCAVFGTLLRAGNNYRQAIQQFQRLETLMPGDPGPPSLLAQTYLMVPSHETGLGYAFPGAGAAFFDAAEAADRAVRNAPDDTNALYLKSLSLFELGSYLEEHTNETDRPFPPATQVFSNTLATADLLLLHFGKDPNILAFKATVFMKLARYDDALPLLNQSISFQTNINATLYFTRATANFQAGKLDAARNDYEFLVKNDPQTFAAYYWLGKIADTNKNFSEAVQNYQLYLTNAPDSTHETDEYKQIKKRVGELKKSSD